MSKNIINTNIRFNLDNADDRKAYEYLQRMDRKQYKSYTKAVVIALIEHFERQQQLEADSYLETREKEDAFIARVLDAVRHSAPSLPVTQETKAEEDENVEAMFAFLDGFE